MTPRWVVSASADVASLVLPVVVSSCSVSGDVIPEVTNPSEDKVTSADDVSDIVVSTTEEDVVTSGVTVEVVSDVAPD